MNQEQIKHITNNHYRELKNHFKKVGKGFDIEDVHQFRVEYKKLRAFLRMISLQMEPAKQIKFSKKLRKGYNISGNIRDLQLQQQQITEASAQTHRKPKAYLNLLQKEINKLQAGLSEIFLNSPVDESKKKTSLSVPDKFPEKSFLNFIQQKWSAVYSIILSAHFSDTNIHTIRKNLKDLFYNMKIYEGVKNKLPYNNILKGIDEEYLNNFLDELGSFQDKCMAIALLKSYLPYRLNAYNREILEQIKSGWIKEKLTMKRLLVKQLKTEIGLHNLRNK